MRLPASVINAVRRVGTKSLSDCGAPPWQSIQTKRGKTKQKKNQAIILMKTAENLEN